MQPPQERHRPSALKQQNKSHKHGRHRSKGSLDKINKGKVALKTISKGNSRELRREERRNQATQLRHKKREESFALKRQVGTARTAPILVAVIALTQNADPIVVREKFVKSDADTTVTHCGQGFVHLSVPRLKQRFSLYAPQPDNLTAALDVLKVADSVVFVLSVADDFINDDGECLLQAAFSQGLPTPVLVATDLADLPIKKRNEVKQNMQKMVSKWIPEEKVSQMDNEMDAQVILRRLGGQKRKSIAHRENRSHLIADEVQYIPGSEAGYGTLKLTGYIRAQALDVNGLVHIPGMGDFQLEQLDAPEDAHPLITGRKENTDAEMEETGDRLLEKADPARQESLVSENIPDPLDAEQTWPTAEEMAEAEDKVGKKKIMKKVPKGTSEYQAAWIPDSDGESCGEDDDDDESEDDMLEPVSEEESQCGEEDAEDMESVTMSEAPDSMKYDKEMDIEEERQALQNIKGARMDQMYPDEIDTPMDTPARIRFQKYRGLKSFRTSPWDVKEELPLDYARIFQFQNFANTRKKILTCEDRPGSLPGWYVTVHVKNVPEKVVLAHEPGQPIIIFGMLPHETKMTVMNVVMKRCRFGYQEPIKSKETLIIHLGYRRFVVNPIFSQHTNGSKHKYERYFQPDGITVATFFAPIMFPPATCLVFKPKTDGTEALVATGSLLSVDPDRVILKRTLLSGHPFKVNKKSAVVRFMFFNREDINWFKPLELKTKYGRRGHIKEPLGTHGHMKCIFDGQMKSQDTVMLHLYKRVFPKWTYDPTVPASKAPEMEVTELQS